MDQRITNAINAGTTLIGDSAARRVGAGFLFALASATLISLLAVGILRPGSYLNFGNLHDIFLPYTSALAAVQGLELHKDFHTPFGWVYSRLNALSWELVTSSETGLSLNDLIAVASLIWSVGLLGILIAIACLIPMHSRREWLALWGVGQFILFASFNFRGLPNFRPVDITWYGTYNNHLWGLLFSQVVMTSLFYRKGPGKVPVAVLSVLQGFCIALGLNYKISFGLAGLMIAAAALFTLWPGWRWRAIYLIGLMSAASAASLLFAPDSYSYLAYFQDLSYVLEAKSQGTARLAWELLVIGITMTLVLQMFQEISPGKTLREAQRRGEGRNQTITCLLFSIAIGLGINIAIAGDSAHPTYFLFACLAIVFLLGPQVRIPASDQKKYIAIAGLVLGAAFATNLLSDLYIASQKKVPSGERKNVRVELSTPWGAMSWIMTNRVPYDRITKLVRLDEKQNLTSVIADMVFPAYLPEGFDPVPFLNGDYLLGLKSAQIAIRSWSADSELRVAMLEFSNPMPLLLGSKIPRGSYHWIHFGTSVAQKNPEQVLEKFWDATDVIIVPVTAVEGDGFSQMLLNCTFQKWNRTASRPFIPIAVDKFQAYYSRIPFGPPLKEFQTPDIDRRCDHLLALFQQGVLTP